MTAGPSVASGTLGVTNLPNGPTAYYAAASVGPSLVPVEGFFDWSYTWADDISPREVIGEIIEGVFGGVLERWVDKLNTELYGHPCPID